jgi:uncharacterized protein (PEP-CTERM system associated)
MAITKSLARRPALRRAAQAVSAALMLLALQAEAGAAEWTVSPGIGLRETYSDNIGLTADATARSDWVTELIPRLDVAASGPQFKLNGYYALHYLHYQRDTSPSRTLHDAGANANANLLKDWLYVDGSLSISQQRISAFGPQSIDIVNTTGNRGEIRTYNLSPYLRHDFNGFALAELRATYQKTSSTELDSLDGHTERLFADLSSGAAFARWGWGLNADKETVHYSNAPDVELSRYTGTLRYALSPRLSLNTMVGYEDNNYLVSGGSPEGKMWSVGASWVPSEVSSLSATAGHRYFGRTFSLAGQHRSSHAAWSLSYNEDVTTQNATSRTAVLNTSAFLNQLWSGSIPDAGARQQVVDAFIRTNDLPPTLSGNIAGLSNRAYLQKFLQASVALDGARNTVVLRVFNVRREPLSTATGTGAVPPTSAAGLDDNSLQTGVAATWTMRLSPRTSVDASTEFSRSRSYAIDRTDRMKAVRLGLSQQFGRRTTGVAELRRQQRDSSDPAADYTENALTFFVSMQF